MSRFLFISTVEGLPWGGSEALWTEVAHRLLENGHHVAYSCKYFADEPEKLLSLKNAGAISHYRGDPNLSKPLKRLFRAASRLKRQWENKQLRLRHELISATLEERPDLVILNCYNAYSVWRLSNVFAALRAAHVPYAIISQLEDDNYAIREQPVEALRSLYGGACEVSCGSKQGLDLLQRQFVVGFQNGFVFDNPVNCRRVSQSWPKLPTKTRRFACVGRIDPVSKGQDLLLQAFSSDVWQSRDWHLTFYGQGVLEAHLVRLVKQYNLQERVTIAGFHHDIDKLWAEEEVCLQPSSKEGTPMTFVEAMFCGRPCLVSDVARMPELVQDGINGWVCSRGVYSLSEGINRLWADRDRWEQMGANAHLRVSQVWDSNYPQTMAKRYVEHALRGASGSFCA